MDSRRSTYIRDDVLPGEQFNYWLSLQNGIAIAVMLCEGVVRRGGSAADCVAVLERFADERFEAILAKGAE